jgi:hypothetical protein
VKGSGECWNVKCGKINFVKDNMIDKADAVNVPQPEGQSENRQITLDDGAGTSCIISTVDSGAFSGNNLVQACSTSTSGNNGQCVK